MSIREDFPGDRAGGATQDVAAILAGIALPTIEPFGSDSPVLAGVPPYIVPAVPGVVTRLEVARSVYDAGIAALTVLKRLEDAMAACKAELAARVMGAAVLEAAEVELNAWQGSVAETSAASNIAVALQIPELTASALAHHSVDLIRNHPDTLAALKSGTLTWPHACIVLNEIGTLQETPGVSVEQLASFEELLLRLAVRTTASAFSGKARRARESMFPASISTRTRQAFAKRKMVHEPGRDNMSWLTLHLPSLAAESIMTRCTRIARAVKEDARNQQLNTTADGGGGATADGGGEFRTLAQLRVDIAAILLMGLDLPVNSYSTAERASGTGTNTGTGTDSTPGFPFGGASAFGVVLIDQEPVWAHKLPDRPTGPPHTPTTASTMTFTSTGEADPAGFETESTDGQHPPGALTSGTAPPRLVVSGEHIAHQDIAMEDDPVAGLVLGDGSGYADGLVDGIEENPMQEYLDQLELLRLGAVVSGPPLPQAEVLLKVPFLGLLGVTDEPAELVGTAAGPVPEEIARKLLAGSATFLRVLTDPVTGEPLPLNPQRYTLREAERAVLQAIAGACYVPNCPNPVTDTDLDHLRAFEFGGPSTLENLRPACAKHHLLKHFKDDKDRNGNYRRIREPQRSDIQLRGWTPKPLADGRVGWITPTGAYEPPPYAEPQRTMYPKWLKKRLNKALRQTAPSADTIMFSLLEERIISYVNQHGKNSDPPC
ncbi:HNH endonuclease signature motif containing protein [Arthrobacter sp. LAPM80]|uniref:HNH endonuclease signature motif containing protein n=1 Tax=Arthrobacter sp. LAPM80 TaxID=3141788 RepID=UPI00398AF6F0